MHNKQAQSQKEITLKEEKTIKCPLSGIVLVACPNTMCFWRNTKAHGNCGFSEKADETDLAVRLGMTLEAASLEIRRSKAAIQKILVLDKYVEFVRSKMKEKMSGKAQAFESDVFLVSLKDKSNAWNGMFHMSMELFLELCKKKNYKEFIRANKAVASYKLASILGMRESLIEKVNARYNSLVRKKSTRSGNPKTLN